MKLRPFQEEAISSVSRALKVHKRVCLQSPTGSGKTVIGSKMMTSCVNTGWRVMFLVHREELVDQTSRTLTRNGVDHGFVANGYPTDYGNPVLVCMVATLVRRLDRVPAPKIIFIDEAHHAITPSYRKILEAFPDALVVGLTATPERLDGRGLDDVFRALVPGKSPRWLMDEGFLCDYEAWTQPAPDLSAIKKRGNDYDLDALAAKMMDKVLVGDAVAHYLKHCPGERGVSFCVNIKHALMTRDAFKSAGVRCEELDGEAPGDVRRNIIKAFRNGEIEVLTSVDLFGEGFDLPELAVAIMQRPTDSLALYLQQCGRALRPVYHPDTNEETREGRLWGIANGPKPHAFILDHAGNIHFHGKPCIGREWTLEGRKKGPKKESGPSGKVCPQCFGTSLSGTKCCPWCKWEFVLTPREVEQIAGELVKVEKEAIRRAEAGKDAHDVKTFEEVVLIYTARGHADPVSAADWFWRSSGNEVTEQQYIDALRSLVKAKKYQPYWIDHKVRLRREAIAARERKKKGEAA